MTQPGSKPSRAGVDLSWLALTLACMVGAGLRLWHLDRASLYTDEAFTFAISSLPVPSLLHALATSDFHPPFFYLLTHALMNSLRWPEWNYRYLTAPLGVVTIVATWGAARRLAEPIAASVAALAVALAPALVAYDRMYRMYVVLVAASVLSWWLLIEARRASGRARTMLWAAYGITAIVVAYTHYLGLLVLACQGCYALTRADSRRPMLAVLAAAAIAYAPWIGSLLKQMPHGGMVMTRPSLDQGLAESVRGAFAMGVPDALASLWGGLWIPLALVALTMLVAGWLTRTTALPFWMGCLPLAVAASIVFNKNLAYFPQYLLIDIPPVAIGAGAIVAAVSSTRAAVAAPALAAALIALYAFAASNVLFDPYYQFPDWYAVNGLILEKERPGDAIVLDAGYEFLVVRNFTAFRNRTVLSFMNAGDFAPILRWIAQHPKSRIWYVGHQNYYWDPGLRIESALRSRPPLLTKRFARQFPVNEVRVMLFDKVPMTKIP